MSRFGRIIPISDWKRLRAQLARLKAQEGLGVGLYTGNGCGYLLVKERARLAGELDVEWLHREILPRWAGKEPEVSYTQDVQQALRQLTRHKSQGLFLLSPPSMQEVMERARGGLRMPGKTTFFYPKPLAGLVEYQWGRVLRPAP